MVTDYIMGSSSVHERLCAMVEILGKIVSSAPRSVSIVQLEEATGRTARELARLCLSLVRAELLVSDAQAANRWKLACEPSAVTLEDVFRCIVTEQPERARPAAHPGPAGRAANDVDLLVTQAMLAVNQSVFKNLRQFSLDRLKASAAGMFPAPGRHASIMHFDDCADLAGIGHDAAPPLPVQACI